MNRLSDLDLRALLQRQFGFPNFRPGQLTAIHALMSHGRLLCIHPTGFGKSLMYQLPATLLDGMTVIVSPLLALMRDQEAHLNDRFSIPAASLNSDQSEDENAAVWRRLGLGEIKILFVAPEQLDNVGRFEQLLDLPIDLLVVDEAHCISTWGHDFRPSYRQILRFVQAVEHRRSGVRILGLTATANHVTEEDITRQLATSDRLVEVLRESMSRPNIALSAQRLDGLAHKLAACCKLVNALDGCGLIYCATRENTETVAKYLSERGVSCAAYHAGFAPEDKRALQIAFLEDDFKVLAATNALGMGIDKSNLRFIIHFDVPGSITAYYQEIGRCGRDGLPAHAALLYDAADLAIQRHFIDSAQPSAADFATVLDVVGAAEIAPNLTTIKRLTGLHPTRVTVVIAELVEQGFLRKKVEARTQVYEMLTAAHPPDLSRYLRQREVKLRELASMQAYAERSTDCRMATLREALGDDAPERCGTCDTCMLAAPLMLDVAQVQAASTWLGRQGVPIAANKPNKVEAGLALLDGRARRGPLFVAFMRARAMADQGLPDAVWHMLYEHVQQLAQAHPQARLVAVPSRTWAARNSTLERLGEITGLAPLDILVWRQPPDARQGALLNNDQRHHNVNRRMGCAALPLSPPAAIVLIDDYVGSGSTLKEACRALRKEAQFTGAIIPVTIAAVKWKLGQAGMI